MQFTIDPKLLSHVLSAVETFASKDPTRQNLSLVEVQCSETALTLTATDGHTLCHFILPAGSEAKPGRACLLPHEIELLKAARKEKLPIKTFTVDDNDKEFPNWRGALSPAEEPSQFVRFNAQYLARLAPVQKALKADDVTIRQTSNDCPTECRIESNFGKAFVIIMPRRCETTYQPFEVR